jgi:antitoxin MazE
MRAKVVQIGNSRGVRIPKSILTACGIGDMVDLSVDDGKIVLQAAPQVRQGWAEAAQEMARQQDDELLDPPTPTAFDEDEWEW